MRRARSKHDCAVILMTGRGSMETVMAATEAGHSIISPSPLRWRRWSTPSARAEKSLGEPDDDEAASIDDLAGDGDDRQLADA